MKNKKKKKFSFPQRSPLLYLLMILIPIIIFFLIAIPVLYVNNYNQNKVIVFQSDIEGLKEKDAKLIKGNLDTIEDFKLHIYCTSYDDNKGTATFRVFALRNEKTDSVIKANTKVNVKLGMYSDWIKVESTSSVRSTSIAKTAKQALSSSTYYRDHTISNLPNLPKSGSLPFVKINSIPLYAYVYYDTSVSGSVNTKYYLLKIEYNDYITGKVIFDEGTNDEVVINPTTGGIEK